MTLQELEKRYPEWRPWLEELGETLAELADPRWDAEVPETRVAFDPAGTPMPLLHACRRRWGVPEHWARGDCPVCGAWAGFAETCGVERARYLRCVRCGASWPAHALACIYCGNGDHEALGRLVADGREATWALEVCRRCKGYLKSFTVLRPCAPERTLLADLASVELDLAAQARGYRRP